MKTSVAEGTRTEIVPVKRKSIVKIIGGDLIDLFKKRWAYFAWVGEELALVGVALTLTFLPVNADFAAAAWVIFVFLSIINLLKLVGSSENSYRAGEKWDTTGLVTHVSAGLFTGIYRYIKSVKQRMYNED